MPLKERVVDEVFDPVTRIFKAISGGDKL